VGGSRCNPVLLQILRSSATNAAVAMAQQGKGYLQSMFDTVPATAGSFKNSLVGQGSNW
jgi:hypothetical protein